MGCRKSVGVAEKLVVDLQVYEVQLEFLLSLVGILKKNEDGNIYVREGKGSCVYV